MNNLNLDRDEAIVLESEEVLRLKQDGDYDELDHVVLTNKRVYGSYEKGISLFKKSSTEIYTWSLSDIKIINGQAQVQQVTYTGELCLRIQFMKETVYLAFSDDPEETMLQWILEINKLLGSNAIIPPPKPPKEKKRLFARKRTDPADSKKTPTSTADDPAPKPSAEKVHTATMDYVDAPQLSSQSFDFEEEEKPVNVYPQRQQAFAGNIQKCPSCGEPLAGFEVVCHACGHELRNTEVSSAVQKFANELARLEASKQQALIESTSREGKKQSKIIQEKINTINQQIVNAIKNFPIPNTKEDIFEFMVLASSNIDIQRIDAKYYGESTTLISRAWYTKFEQAYQKARLAFGDSPDFYKIKEIFDDKKSEVEKEKKKNSRSFVLMMFGSIGIMFLVAIITMVFYILGIGRN